MERQLLVLDQNILTEANSLLPFALTDVLTELAGIYDQPMLHFWQLDQTFILGMKDARLPKLAQGLKSMLQNQYQPILRNSGGLGVIADAGVLNVSLILPSIAGEKVSIDYGYEEMTALVRQVFGQNIQIEAKEIPTSYCPGKYDLSIENQKFAGIAQRRVKNGVAVMMYLSVNGNQAKRGTVVKQFYDTALPGSSDGTDFPAIDPQSMANLSELLQEVLTIEEVKTRLTAAASTSYHLQVKPITAPEYIAEMQFNEQLQRRLEGMRQRNTNIQAMISSFSEENEQ